MKLKKRRGTANGAPLVFQRGVVSANAVSQLSLSLFVAFIFPCLACTQAPSQEEVRVAHPQTASRQAAEPIPTSPDQLTAIEKHLSAIEVDQKTSASDVQGQFDRVEKEIDDLKRSTLFATVTPALIAALAGLSGVLLGGFQNERLQGKRAQQERELSGDQAKLQIGNAVVEWQLKQLSLLYGPIRALLGQSFGLYRQMNKALETADNKRFRFAEAGEGLDKQQFQVQTSPGKWERFRTVMHISEVYGNGFGVETYFDEIVSIGARIVKIIERNAGYARPEEKELMSVFAKYLAHFAVLKHLHGEAKRRVLPETTSRGTAESQESVMKVDLSAVFPEEIHGLIDNGFQAITNDIQQWRLKAGA